MIHNPFTNSRIRALARRQAVKCRPVLEGLEVRAVPASHALAMLHVTDAAHAALRHSEVTTDAAEPVKISVTTDPVNTKNLIYGQPVKFEVHITPDSGGGEVNEGTVKLQLPRGIESKPVEVHKGIAKLETQEIPGTNNNAPENVIVDYTDKSGKWSPTNTAVDTNVLWATPKITVEATPLRYKQSQDIVFKVTAEGQFKGALPPDGDVELVRSIGTDKWQGFGVVHLKNGKGEAKFNAVSVLAPPNNTGTGIVRAVLINDINGYYMGKTDQNPILGSVNELKIEVVVGSKARR